MQTYKENELLLAIDLGNTNTVLGVYSKRQLIARWRLRTESERTADEYGMMCRSLFTFAGLDADKVTAIAIASVVRELNFTWQQVALKYFRIEPFFATAANAAIDIDYNQPQDVGIDRIVNVIAAYHKYGGPCIVIDFGTATTFDACSSDGAYLGGVIVAGIKALSEGLQKIPRLPRIGLQAPSKVVGKSTVDSMNSGLYFGYIGLVEGILNRMMRELGLQRTIIATGGLASLIAKDISPIEFIEEDLTLEGLRLIYERNSIDKT
ncbi:MAG: type III pantothenate kinase [Acidobacteriota bacterium]|nr:type III pantothenate kinase [Blastocatellia bacterium]MDW8412827.1 type III pantothenate kinase [Acidobacteriota bacterium]